MTLLIDLASIRQPKSLSQTLKIVSLWDSYFLINPKIKEIYPDTDIEVRQVVGIDTSELFVARTGIRGDNDLVWVGNAANMAAKMCAIRDGEYSTFISNEVYEKIIDEAKFDDNGKNMWLTYHWPEYSKNIYCTSYYWEVK